MLLSSALSWASIGLGLLAAILWFWSTRVRYVKRHADITPAERSIWLFTADPEVREQSFLTAQIQNRWNRRAAIVIALSVVCQALATLATPHGP